MRACTPPASRSPAEADSVRSRTRSGTCWVVYFDRPDTQATASSGLAPVAVTSSEQEALQLLEQLLASAPGRSNLVEDYPFCASDRKRKSADDTRDTVHLVVTIESDDGPTVSEVFDSIDSATKHAEELRQHGASGVSVTDMVMNAIPT